MDLVEFWSRFQSGVEVAVANSGRDRLLGVRDGFHRFFHDGLDRPVPVSVAAQPDGEDEAGYVPLTDEEILHRARDRALELRSRLGEIYPFSACSESGLHTVEVEGEALHFVRTWTALCGPTGEAVGGSSSIQLPPALIEGLDQGDLPYALPVPGKRRHGGMASSITGGLETRRSEIASATLAALSTLLYGILESRPVR